LVKMMQFFPVLHTVFKVFIWYASPTPPMNDLRPKVE